MSSKLIVIIVGAFLVAGYAHAGVDQALLCKEKKAKATGKKASDLLKAFGKNIKKENPSKLGSDISKAQSRFTKGFTRAEAGGQCLTSGDSDAIEAKVNAFVEDMVARLSPRFVDNGDGTITDNQTGLMWEKKDYAGGIHDMHNRYSWAGCCDGDCWPIAENFCQPNAAAAAVCSTQTGGAVGCSECSVGTCYVDPYGGGGIITTIWDWLAADMNQPPGFAGYSDWRIPEIKRDGGVAELETILLAEYFPDPCGTSPCIHPVFEMDCTRGCTVTDCSCTGSYWYWASPTHALDAFWAWFVSFDTGDEGLEDKHYDNHIRAVRGGSVTPPSSTTTLLPSTTTSSSTTVTLSSTTTSTTLCTGRFCDNGDGTITDNQTGLMWEKKDDNNAGGINDVDHRYTWAGCCGGYCFTEDDLCQPDDAAADACTTQTGGAVGCSVCIGAGQCDWDPYRDEAIGTIWQHVYRLNADGFGGYTDWRIPEVNRDGGAEELQSLIDLSQVGAPSIFDEFKVPCSPGCVLPSCSCTASYAYWSSATYAAVRDYAWFVSFGNGFEGIIDKDVGIRVRAVRGGS